MVPVGFMLVIAVTAFVVGAIVGYMIGWADARKE